MKTTSLFMALIAFIPGLLFGLWVSGQINWHPGSDSIPSAPAASYMSIPDDAHRLILVTSVNRLSTEEVTVRGIWLVTYYNPPSAVGMIPLYPTKSHGEVIADQSLIDSFKLHPTEDGLKPDDEYLEQFADRDLALNGYLILDDIALQQALSMVGVSNTQADKLSSVLPLEDTRLLYLQQAQTTDRFCAGLAHLDHFPAWSQLLLLAPDHILSNLDLDAFLEEWQQLVAQPGGLRCDFPLMWSSPPYAIAP